LSQQLVSVTRHMHCGFDLCPKKYKYLGNPQLLEKIFSNPNPVYEKIQQVTRPRHLDEVDLMHTTNCIGCNKEYLLLIDNPLCLSCRRII